MGLNDTVHAERLHIAFFGRCNAGKSSLVNAVTGQNASIVSAVKGTTTDPVKKAMELLPLGPVLIIDTPGLDDSGTVGALRVQKANQILNMTDLAVLVVDGTVGLAEEDQRLIERFQAKGIPYLIAYNKSDLKKHPTTRKEELTVSSVTGEQIHLLKEMLGQLIKGGGEKTLLGHLLAPEDVVLLVTPIDSSAPKGRLILPQVQTLRAALDGHAIAVVTQTNQLPAALAALQKAPKLVITDSQAFGTVSKLLPESILLTSFSILFAQYKGLLETAVRGVSAVHALQDGDKILISEGCSHHRQCEDIGTVKLPRWLQDFSGKSLQFDYTAGGEFPDDLTPYALVAHCGGCMLNERALTYRRKCAEDQHIPFTNYGILIAHLHGILKRSLAPFPEMQALLP